MEAEYVLYTYQTVNGKLVCDFYAAQNEAEANFAGQNLQSSVVTAQEPSLNFMVGELKSMPV